MKVLFVTPRFPYPPHKGDQVLAFHRLRTLSARHEIVLLTFYEREVELEGLPRLAPYCREIHPVRLARWQSYLNMLALGPISRTPLQVLYYRSWAFRRKLEDLLARERFDVVHGFLLRVGPYLRALEVPRVLELIDSMQLNMRHTVERSRGLRRLLYGEELRRIEPYERAAGALADRLVFVSDVDRAMVPFARALTLAVGVAGADEVAAAEHAARPIVMLTGKMDYLPNIEAAGWFARRCWGAVRAAFPDAEFWIVGGDPAPAVTALGKIAGVKVTGFVPDMAAALRQAQVAVAPMRFSGSGMHIKLLEAMAAGLPVVTTRLGLGVIGARVGEEILVADTPAEFGATVVALLGDAARRTAVGARARAYVRAHHSWDRAADQIDFHYAALANAQARGEGEGRTTRVPGSDDPPSED